MKFTFEKNPHPDTNPNFSIEQVVSSSTETTYRVDIPAQDPEQTYRSFLMYIVERDIPVTICNVQISLGDTVVEGIPCESTGGDGGGDDDGGGNVGQTLVSGDSIDFNDAEEREEIVFTDFGEAMTTSFVADPTDASKTVALSIKGAAGGLYDGVTIDAGNFVFPVTESENIMSVRVLSPKAGIVVKLKLEDASGASVETNATTTAGDAWEVLTFDLSNHSEGTAALDASVTYSKISLFFDFNVAGSVDGGVEIYWDSLTWVGAPNTLTLTLSGASDATAVRIVGTWWNGWDAASGPEATANTDGTWTVVFDPKPTGLMEYKWLIDGEQENLITPAAAGECSALIDGLRLATDYETWGNRNWDPTPHGTSYTDYANACAEPEVTTLTLTLSGASDATAVRIVGTWWNGWDAASGPEATANTDGTWTVVFDPKPTGLMEYKWLIDGEQENLITPAAAGECSALIDGLRLATDYETWGNRNWDPTPHGTSYTDYANACAEPEVTTLTLTLSGASDATAVRIVGTWWNGWDAASGPEATANTDGTWTVVFDPKPTGLMEYKWLIDGEQENLITPAAAGECSALIDGLRLATDYETWGNRNWDPTPHGTSYTDYANACAEPEVTTLTLTLSGASDATAVRIVGTWWNGWDAASGPEATANTDGTWTVVFDPKPTGLMEYKWLIDGEQENLITPAAAGECSALIDGLRLATDYETWGNRNWDPTPHGTSYTDYANACADGP